MRRLILCVYVVPNRNVPSVIVSSMTVRTVYVLGEVVLNVDSNVETFSIWPVYFSAIWVEPVAYTSGGVVGDGTCNIPDDSRMTFLAEICISIN